MKSYKTFANSELLFKLADYYTDIEVLPFGEPCLEVPNNWLRMHGYSMRKEKAIKGNRKHG